MFKAFIDEISGKGLGLFVGMLFGGFLAWLAGYWRRYQERRSILTGDARDTVAIHHHIVERTTTLDGKPQYTLRIRSMGQSELSRVVPNGHLAAVLLHRALAVTPKDTLISMEGPEGSFLLETITNYVCDRAANLAFDHDLYVMAPCCEPAEMAEHQPIAILLIRVKDLQLFEHWPMARSVLVEHGADGSRVLTLMELAQRFKKEQTEIARRRAAVERTKHVETMYILDLALDKRCAAVPTKPIPWDRFEPILKTMNLRCEPRFSEAKILPETVENRSRTV
jgi:hypothetical protein